VFTRFHRITDSKLFPAYLIDLVPVSRITDKKKLDYDLEINKNDPIHIVNRDEVGNYRNEQLFQNQIKKYKGI